MSLRSQDTGRYRGEKLLVNSFTLYITTHYIFIMVLFETWLTTFISIKRGIYMQRCGIQSHSSGQITTSTQNNVVVLGTLNSGKWGQSGNLVCTYSVDIHNVLDTGYRHKLLAYHIRNKSC